MQALRNILGSRWTRCAGRIMGLAFAVCLIFLSLPFSPLPLKWRAHTQAQILQWCENSGADNSVCVWYGLKAASFNGGVYIGGTINFPSGPDIATQLNSLYTNAQFNGQKAFLIPPLAGGCYNTAVPIVWATQGKYVSLEGSYLGNQTGAVKQGSCINFTPTGTITATAANVTSNLTTFTFSSNPQTFGFLVGESMNIAGFTGADTFFNQSYSVATVTSTQVTATFIGGHANASATSTGTASHTALTLDYTPTQGGGFTPNTILKNIIIENNGCVNTVGGCGSASNGIVFGPNAGVHSGKLENSAVYGFLNNLVVPNGQAGNIGWSLTFDNFWSSSGGTGFALVNLATSETTRWRGGGFSNNGTGFSCGTSITTDLTFDTVSFDVNNLGISNAGCRITLNAPHFENSNFAGAGLPYITQGTGGTITINGGRMMQDQSTGGPDAQMMTITAGSINTYGLEVNCGRTVTNLINNTGGGEAKATWYTESPALCAPDVAGVPSTCTTAYQCEASRIIGSGNQVAFKTVIPVLQAPFTGAGNPAGTASTGLLYFNGTTNRWNINQNNNGAVTLGTTGLFSANGNEQLTAPHIVQDTATLSGGTVAVTLTAPAAFTSASSYTCVAKDITTPANAVSCTQTSGTSITLTGTATDVVRFIAVGN